MSLTKSMKPKTKKFFFHCRVEDLLSLLRVLAQSTGKLWSCKVAWK